MADRSFYMLFIPIITEVVSDWIELPKVNPTDKYSLRTSDRLSDTIGNISLSTQMPLTTPFNQILTTFFGDEYVTEPNHNTSIVLKNISTNKKLNKTTFIKQVNEDITNKIPYSSNNPFYNMSDVKSYDSSKIVEETLQNVENDEPHKSIEGKLNYLKTLQNRLYAEIRRTSRGIWTARQARTKKLMGFGTFEGALMTIAFLTFSVFLIKIIFQFIRSLQSQDLMMLTLPPTIASSGQRFRREDNKLAAAKLLQYMDEFSMKHQDNCDSL